MVTEEAFDLVGSDSGYGSDVNTLETIRLRWKETTKRHSLRMFFSHGVGTLDRLWAISVRLSEYRAPIVTAGLFTRDELQCLCLDANLLGQGFVKHQREQRTNVTCTYPAVIIARTARISDSAERYTKVVVCSPSNRLAHVERPEQRVTIHWNKLSTTPPSQDPAVRTSSHRVIETDVHECVGKGGGLRRSGSETGCAPGERWLTEIREPIAQRLVNIPV